LQILKANKTPFIIALNKIDNISGWKTPKDLLFLNSLEAQASNVKENFEEKYYTLIGALHSHGITAEMYSKITDFRKNVAVVPCSAETGQGISEILAMITALSQKFLTEKITVSKTAKGVILEVKKERTGTFLECILYDGTLKLEDEIAIANLEGETLATKMRTMQEALPLNKGYVTKKEVSAAAGIKLQIISKEDIMPGMPFQVIDNNLDQIKKEFENEISEELQTDESGIVIKADSLGSLEALLVLLKQHNIKVIKAGIGPIIKKDIYTAAALPNLDKIILGFNVDVASETDIEELSQIKVITSKVVYKLIEDFEEYRDEKTKETEKKKLDELPKIAKITILDFVFRNSNPAVFGVVVNSGTLRNKERFINSNDEKIGQVKEVQEDRKNVSEALKGAEVAISIPGVNFERQLTVGESLYTNLSETQFRKFKDNKSLLTSDEKTILQEIAAIKRRANPTWGV